MLEQSGRQFAFFEWRCWCCLKEFHWNLLPMVYLTICYQSDDGLMPNKCQAITWINGHTNSLIEAYIKCSVTLIQLAGKILYMFMQNQLEPSTVLLLSLVVNFGTSELASRSGTNELEKQKNFAIMGTKTIMKCMKNWITIVFII